MDFHILYERIADLANVARRDYDKERRKNGAAGPTAQFLEGRRDALIEVVNILIEEGKDDK